jgi:hypothetical protein
MSDYSPFGKPLHQIRTKDLSALREVAEGWYVEYKSEVPDASSIAKSISAFANTYGGWLFYGIDELSQAGCVAGRYPGVPNDQLDGQLHRIRMAVADSLNPIPHFDVAVLAGPDDQLGLTADSSIICVKVPRGHAAPYVHRSGRIYRRVGDGSEPKPETDRFVLDQLWQRGKRIREEYSEWLVRDLELSKREESQPFLRIFLVPDLWLDQDIWVDLTTSRVREIVTASNEVEETFSFTPFDTAHRTASGYVCRQLAGNDPCNLTATWFLRPNLVGEVIFPLPLISDAELSSIVAKLDGYDHAKDYVQILRRMGHETASIVDLNFVFSSLLGVMHIQSLLIKEAGHCGSFFSKAELLNVWRTCPFLDAPSVIKHQQEHGVPMCMHDRFFAPPSKDPETFTELPALSEIERARDRKMWRAIMAFESIAHAFGIETGSETAGKTDDEMSLIHFELFAAAERAMAAQERRNERHREWNR